MLCSQATSEDEECQQQVQNEKVQNAALQSAALQIDKNLMKHKEIKRLYDEPNLLTAKGQLSLL